MNSKSGHGVFLTRKSNSSVEFISDLKKSRSNNSLLMSQKKKKGRKSKAKLDDSLENVQTPR